LKVVAGLRRTFSPASEDRDHNQAQGCACIEQSKSLAVEGIGCFNSGYRNCHGQATLLDRSEEITPSGSFFRAMASLSSSSGSSRVFSGQFGLSLKVAQDRLRRALAESLRKVEERTTRDLVRRTG